MMNKIDNILDYYKGNLAYTYFLLDLAYEIGRASCRERV